MGFDEYFITFLKYKNIVKVNYIHFDGKISYHEIFYGNALGNNIHLFHGIIVAVPQMSS